MPTIVYIFARVYVIEGGDGNDIEPTNANNCSTEGFEENGRAWNDMKCSGTVDSNF